jgi:hypothetical protein
VYASKISPKLAVLHWLIVRNFLDGKMVSAKQVRVLPITVYPVIVCATRRASKALPMPWLAVLMVVPRDVRFVLRIIIVLMVSAINSIPVVVRMFAITKEQLVKMQIRIVVNPALTVPLPIMLRQALVTHQRVNAPLAIVLWGIT